MKAFVLKVTESGKSMLVGVRNSKYSIGNDMIGYCLNPINPETKNPTFVVGDEVPDFDGVTVESRKDKDGKVMTTKGGEPLSFWVF